MESVGVLARFLLCPVHLVDSVVIDSALIGGGGVGGGWGAMVCVLTVTHFLCLSHLVRCVGVRVESCFGWFGVKCLSVDVCIYSTCLFFSLPFFLLFSCHTDVDNVQHRELIHYFFLQSVALCKSYY